MCVSTYVREFTTVFVWSQRITTNILTVWKNKNLSLSLSLSLPPPSLSLSLSSIDLLCSVLKHIIYTTSDQQFWCKVQ